MIKRAHLGYMILLFLLFIPTAVVSAQNVPEPVQAALSDLSQRYGRVINLSDLQNWTWSEHLYTNNGLGCERLDNPATPQSILGYQVELIYNDITYDYRVAKSPPILFLCSPLPTSTPRPIPTFQIVTATPNISPTPSITPTPSSCPGSPPARLRIGEQARVTPGDQPNNIRSSPGASSSFVGEIPPEAVFTVLDGPRCASGLSWWQVSYNGMTGWTPEGEGAEYWVEPLIAIQTAATAQPTSMNTVTLAPTLALASPTATPTQIICAPNLPPRLVVGQQGRVTPGLPNNLRSAPGESSQYVGEIPAEGVFTVLEGPSCASGMAWWRVEYNGLVGWTTEGKDAEYWTEPLVPAVLPSPIPLNSATPPTTSKLAQPREVINRGNFYRMTPLAELGEKCVISDVRAFSADSTFFACVNIVDSTIHIWNVKTGEEVRVIREFYEEVFDIVANFSLSFSPIEPEVFALTTRDNRIYQWNVNTGEHSVLATLQNNLKRLTFSPDGKVVAAQDFSGTITLIDAASGGINATFVTGDEDIFSIVYSSDGTKLAAMNVNGRYWIWDVTSMTLVREGQLQSPRMDMSFRLVYQPNDSFMAAASNEVLLHLWNVDTGEILSIVEGNYAGRKVAFSSDGTFYAAMTAKSNFVMYDTNTHQVIFEYPVNDTYVPDDLGFSPDGTLFVITAIGSPTRLWGVPAGELQG